MYDRSNWISPILQLLNDNLDGVLPAVGGATEDMELPDVDELEDMLINRDTREVTEFLETPTPSITNLYRATPPIFRPQNHFYRYFIDGSLKTYYLATGVEGNRSFPIELAQIGASVIERDDCGNVHPKCVRHRILLLMPKGPLGVSDSLWQSLKKTDSQDKFFEVIDTTE